MNTKKIFGVITICSMLALPVLAATPVNFGGNGTAWNNDQNQHYVNTNNPDLRMDWDNQRFAVPGKGGHHANENAAIIAWGSGSLVNPVHATNIKVAKKVFLSLDDIGETKGKPATPPGKDKKDNPKEEYTATGVLGDYPVTGDKYAIIIGICDYPGTAHDLCTSDGDSLHMYKALTELYGYEPENIRLFKDGGGKTGFVNPTTQEYITAGIPNRNNILGAIMDIKNNSNLTEHDEVVFFFSGHGSSGIADDGDEEDVDEAIVVHDNDGDVDGDGYSTLDFIWDGELRSWFDGFATTRIAFIFDTCLAGGMNDVASEGRVVSMATEETRSAYVYSRGTYDIDGDGILDGEGVFSRLFVNKGMLQGLADINDYDKVEGNEPTTVEEAFDYAKKNIPGRLKRLQKPVINDNFTDDLLL